jgi:hypothetical protein
MYGFPDSRLRNEVGQNASFRGTIRRAALTPDLLLLNLLDGRQSCIAFPDLAWGAYFRTNDRDQVGWMDGTDALWRAQPPI